MDLFSAALIAGSTCVTRRRTTRSCKPNSQVRSAGFSPAVINHLAPHLTAGTGITPLPNGHNVSRLSDLIIYSVEAAYIGACVKEYGPSTKVGAVVAGQTSVKAPERDAFDKYLPEDVSVVSVHSLHGPSVTTEGQPLVCSVKDEAHRRSLYITGVRRKMCS